MALAIAYYETRRADDEVVSASRRIAAHHNGVTPMAGGGDDFSFLFAGLSLGVAAGLAIVVLLMNHWE